MQWLVEEALMAKLEKHDRDIEAAAHREHALEAAQRRVRDQLDQGRGR